MSLKSRQNTQVSSAKEGQGGQWHVPIPGKTLGSVVLASAALPAAGAYTISNEMSVEFARAVSLFVQVTGPGAGAAQRVSIIPEITPKLAAPLVWFPVGVTDAVPTNNDLSAFPASGYSAGNFGQLTFRPLQIATVALDANTAVLRMSVVIDVQHAFNFRVQIAEIGDTANPSTVSITATKYA